MAFDDTLIVDHIKQTHDTDLLSEREKHLIGLAVTMTRGCQVCTRNRVEKARSIGLTDDELNALIAVTSAVNSGVTAATARVAFGMIEEEKAGECGDVCSVGLALSGVLFHKLSLPPAHLRQQHGPHKPPGHGVTCPSGIRYSAGRIRAAGPA